jgi:hypothetical protein
VKVLEDLQADSEVWEIRLKPVEDATKEVRDRAAAWRNGVASVFTVVLATLVIKETKPTTLTNFDDWLDAILAGMVLGAAVCGLVSLWFLLRAAHGPATLGAKIVDLARPLTTDRALRRLRSTVRDFKIGQGFLIAAIFLFGIPLLAIWFGPSK